MHYVYIVMFAPTDPPLLSDGGDAAMTLTYPPWSAVGIGQNFVGDVVADEAP